MCVIETRHISDNAHSLRLGLECHARCNAVAFTGEGN
jgi:hypothetical protein